MEGLHSVVRPAAGAGWVQVGAGKGVLWCIKHAAETEGTTSISNSIKIFCQARVLLSGCKKIFQCFRCNDGLMFYYSTGLLKFSTIYTA